MRSVTPKPAWPGGDPQTGGGSGQAFQSTAYPKRNILPAAHRDTNALKISPTFLLFMENQEGIPQNDQLFFSSVILPPLTTGWVGQQIWTADV